MTSESANPITLPCDGLNVVEVALGTSDLGLGMASGVPGMVLGDLGAKVVRVVDPDPAPIDRAVAWGRAWHRDKHVIRTADYQRIQDLLVHADVALVYGSEDRIEHNGLGYEDIIRLNPALIHARCRPSRTDRGTVPDYGFLVEAQSGFCAQLQGYRAGPIFVDVRATGGGAAFLLTTSVLALLRRRALTGLGGWTETSLYDGMLATLGTMIGRSEHAPDYIESYWEKGSTFPNFMYRCADNELIQVWVGGKGMYDKLINVLGDEPSTSGYYSDQVAGTLNARAVRWRARFVQQPRSMWIEQLRAAGVGCEPVLAPGDALCDPHLAVIGLAVERHAEADRDTFVGSAISVRPMSMRKDGDDEPAGIAPPLRDGVWLADRDRASRAGGGGLLAGVRVLDFSAFVAGPVSAQVLADLGAEVIKVEPPGGEAMRAAAYAIAACQRGKRSIALDITAPDARSVVERLIRWADVVLHNFRVGVSARLGIDEANVAALNPSAVYCHVSAFGASGPRAKFSGNDGLMQALTGFECAAGGVGNEPLAATWIPIDMAGGWVGAIGALAGLYARARHGRGQFVVTSLLGAGMLLQSGVYQRNGEAVRQPELDGSQTGYGPGYRLYQCGDGKWLAVVIPEPRVWQRVGSLPECAGLPSEYVPLRRDRNDEVARCAEDVLQAAFASGAAAMWLSRLSVLGVLAEIAESMDRDQFRRRILDDPLNQELGRVMSYDAFAWGNLDQVGILLRCGPDAVPTTARMLPDVGEHSVAVLDELGFEQREIDALLAAKVVRQLR